MYGKVSERIGLSPLRSIKKENRCCNICGHTFRPRSVFQRYCHHCKEGEELLRFSDWLPEVDDTLIARLSV